MEGTTTPWTNSGNLLNKGEWECGCSSGWMCTFKYVSRDNPHTLFSLSLWKHVINTGQTHLKLPAKCSRSAIRLFFYRSSHELSLPSFILLRAHELSRQPRSELSLKEFLLLIGSRPKCLHSAAGEALYCLDKLPNTAWRLSNYPPARICVCHHCFVHSSFNLIYNFNMI